MSKLLHSKLSSLVPRHKIAVTTDTAFSIYLCRKNQCIGGKTQSPYCRRDLNYFNNSLNPKQRFYSSQNVNTEKDRQSVLGSTTNNNEILLKKQRHVYDLLSYINSPIFNEEYQEIEFEFDVEQNADLYAPEAHKAFMELWKKKIFLPKGALFSEMNHDHLEQFLAIFGLLYTSKDYDAFYRTAIWARRNINEKMFLYIFSAAVFHRADTQGLAVPPIFEIYPHHCFHREIMEEAENLKIQHFKTKQHTERTLYTVKQKYPDLYNEKDPDKCLSYFREDISVAAFYHCYYLYFPRWMNSKTYSLDEKRGELAYYVHQQYMASHYLQRLSVGAGDYELFSWDALFDLEHCSPFASPNGNSFSSRPKMSNLKEYFLKNGGRWSFSSKYGHGCTFITDYEKRIEEAIDLGYMYTQDGKKIDLYNEDCTNILSNVIDANEDSLNKRYYGCYMDFAVQLLSYTEEPLDMSNTSSTTSLKQFETSSQDPALYKLCRKVTQLFQKYKANLPPYTRENLETIGVSIENVESSPLVTFYEKYYTDITNGMTLTPEEFISNSFRVQVQQYRLNSKPFEIRVDVNSDKLVDVCMKTFIGPSCDENGRKLELSESRMSFLELDQYMCTLKPGKNKIVKKSEHIMWFGKDRTKFLEMYKIIENSKPDDLYQVDDFMNAYPLRYMLPRGKEAGMPCCLYIVIFPYKPFQTEETQRYYETKYNQETIFTTKYVDDGEGYDRMGQYKKIRIDSYPMGFPFDRPVEAESVYYVPNGYKHNVSVYHEVLKGTGS